ncbi:unnamed protein product [Rangifer tarandus platyrhynchus]|uniref:Uncharacterized protein n=1 Tax=Rangifer tarandus platyrhynchus TaxID=3082113 RepID=A0AC59Z1A2_RANTA
MRETRVRSLGRSPGGGDDSHFGVFTWRRPRTEELAGLQSLGSGGVRPRNLDSDERPVYLPNVPETESIFLNTCQTSAC